MNMHAGMRASSDPCTTAFRNGIGDRGVKAVTEAMESNTVLRRLDLRANSIGLVSVHARVPESA